MSEVSIWFRPTFGLLHILVGIAFPIIVYTLYFLKVNRGKLKDRFNLIFRRARTIKVNVRTHSGRMIERFIVPDNRGILHVKGGVYGYVPEAATINARWNIPEITILESQIHPASPDVIRDETEEIIKEKQPDGSFKEIKRKVPFYVLSVARLTPEKLKGHVAQEMKQALDSHIVEDVLTASDRTLKKIELMFLILIANIAVTILMAIVIYSMLNGIQKDLEVLKFAATQANP